MRQFNQLTPMTKFPRTEWKGFAGDGCRGEEKIMNCPATKGNIRSFIKPHKFTISRESRCDSHRQEGISESLGKVSSSMGGKGRSSREETEEDLMLKRVIVVGNLSCGDAKGRHDRDKRGAV